MINQLGQCEELLRIGLEFRRYADGYWQIDGIAGIDVRMRPSDRIPLVSGKKAIGETNVAMLQSVLLEQLRSLVFLTGEEECL
jgi:hypothetical protein